MSDWKKEYWFEGVSQSLESAGIVATKEQIKIIADDMEVCSDNMSMAGGYDVISNKGESEELKKLKKEKEETEVFLRCSIVCSSCKGIGILYDSWGRSSVCDECSGRGRVLPRGFKY